MTHNEFIRELKKHGVEIIDTSGGRHSKKARLNGKTVPIPYHGAKEIRKGTVQAIKKEPGLTY